MTIISASCKKLVEVDPPVTKVTADNAYNTDATAVSVLNGLYSQLSIINYGASQSIPNLSLWTGLSSDELTLWASGIDAAKDAYYKNSLSVTVGGGEFWNSLFPFIFNCNSAIEGLDKSTSLTPIIKQQLLGEAKFMRAFFYFYLTNLYGDLPRVLSTDYAVNALLQRTPKAQIYEQIIADLKDAQSLLNNGYVKGDAMTVYPVNSSERVRPNKAAASALLARVYLYTEDWSNAEVQSTSVINNNSYYKLATINSVFLKGSTEAIWQLQPVTNGTITNTPDAVFYTLSFAPAGLSNSHPVYASSFLLNSFEMNDKRKINWLSSYTDASGIHYYPSKYKNTTTGIGVTPTEYNSILRLGEQYLIRAEARAQQGNISGAQADLDSIRVRAGLPSTTLSSKATLLPAILHERQTELFAELGHRWFDLNRTNVIDSVMSSVCPAKQGVWTSNQRLYPVPISDILKDPNLSQNPGY